MNKVIIISIRPENVADILNLIKKREFRKNAPKGFVGWVYIYVTKAPPFLAIDKVDWDDTWEVSRTAIFYNTQDNIDDFSDRRSEVLNGKIVARWWYDENTEVSYDDTCGAWVSSKTGTTAPELLKAGNIDAVGFHTYYKKVGGNAWHIKKLEIFDTPKELHEFVYKKPTNVGGWKTEITRNITLAPQSWQYAYINERRKAYGNEN